MTQTVPRTIAASPLEYRKPPKLRTSREIQGNILAAFNKDHQVVRFMNFPSAEAGRGWLAGMLGHLSVTEDVEDFNEAFSIARKALAVDPELMVATWTTLSLSYPGILKVAKEPKKITEDLKSFGSLLMGAAGRAEAMGDVGTSDPKHWLFGGPAAKPEQEIHAVVTVASDSPARLKQKLMQFDALDSTHHVKVMHTDTGETLKDDMKGHEHFGYKDGISQPGVKDFHRPDPKDPAQREGHPGSELIAAGEFVFGYPAEKSRPTAPKWLKDGSLHVLRRLKQDVALWNKQVIESAEKMGPKMTPDMMGACFVGRAKSGRPLAQPDDIINGLGTDENNFTYANDPQGFDTPCAAHIRKTHPRSFTDKTHRVMRRGIPYGPMFTGGTKDDGKDRGLLFACYGTSIEDQFEFVQKDWSNNTKFAGGGKGAPTGVDAVTSPDGQAEFNVAAGHKTLSLARVITTMGAMYAITPSVTTLNLLANNKPLPR